VTQGRPFDELATAYDRFRVGYADALYDRLAAWGFTAGAGVIDIGCGTGLATGELVRRGCSVVGTDVSEPMLERARANVPGATFVNAPAEALPFEADTFDAATCAQSFHWFDKLRALTEISRVVRPGGAVAIWWKGLAHDDPTRILRTSIADELGLETALVDIPSGDLLRERFDDFETAGLVERSVVTVPWELYTTPRDFVGYESSRAIARIAFGSRRETYVALLERRLGDPDRKLILRYEHKLYLGRVAETTASESKIRS